MDAIVSEKLRKHDELVAFVDDLHTQELTISNFDSFARQASEIFMPLGTIIGINHRTGYNENSKEWYVDGKRPYWNQRVFGVEKEEVIRVTAFEERSSRRNTPFLYVNFQHNIHECFGIGETRPLRFAFDPGKALYIADVEYTGTEEFPCERLFFRK